MGLALKKFFIVILGLAVLAVSMMVYGLDYYAAPGPLAHESTLIFKRGEGFQAIVGDMAQAGVISDPWLFKAIAIASGDYRKFKAGEYHFTASISPRLVIDMIAAGRVVHKFTIPEGLTVQEIIQLLKAEPALDGDIPADIPEGTLLPDTYHFTYGDKRQELIDRMHAAMTSVVADLWEGRKEGLPFATPEQALVLASIVEKETGIDEERGRVAAVFINRLRKGMKLQSDPTVAYGIDKSGHLDRALTLADLRAETPYNTYVIPGLPPAPIANPGLAAIAAVLSPPDTDELYFVATGTGGHNFSGTLQKHNENVKEYKKVLAKQSQ